MRPPLYVILDEKLVVTDLGPAFAGLRTAVEHLVYDRGDDRRLRVCRLEPIAATVIAAARERAYEDAEALAEDDEADE
jgi:hypothetical protein